MTSTAATPTLISAWLDSDSDGWHALGATHLCLTTMGNGFTTPATHLAALTRAAEELDVGR